MNVKMKKTNGVTLYVITAQVHPGVYTTVGATHGKHLAYRRYRELAIGVSRGKVVRASEFGAANGDINAGFAMVPAPAWLMDLPQVKKFQRQCLEELTHHCQESANREAATQEEVTVELSEKGNTWLTTGKPAELWFQWATGKVWWEINRIEASEFNPTPYWAAALRGTWDHAWR